MLRHFCALISLTLGLTAFLAASSASALTTYSDMTGTSFFFQNMEEETLTAGDPDPIFGGPTVVGDALLFQPTNFTSTGTGGTSDDTMGVFSLDVVSIDKDQTAIERLLLTEIGDYSLTGVGTAATNASAFAMFSIIIEEVSLNGSLVATSINTDVSDSISFDTPTQGAAWSLSLDADIQSVVDALYVGDQAFATAVSIVWNNDLATESELGTTSMIQKKLGVPAVTVSVIPEPSVGLLVGLGLLGLARRPRR